MDEPFLSNRELASLILLGALFVLVLALSSRAAIFWSLLQVLSSLVSVKILIPTLLYVVWVSAVLIPADRLGVWEPSLWKTTLLWLLLSGFGLMFNLSDAIQKPGFFRRTLVRAVGISAIVEFVVNLESFALWVEIPAQMLGVVFAGVAVLAAQDPKHAPAAKLANAYLVSYGLSALAWAIWHLVHHWSHVDPGALAREFLVPLWLTPVALIFIYGFAVFAAYESTFKRMRITRPAGGLAEQRLAIALRTGGSLGTLRLLGSVGAQRLARTSGFREAWNEVGQIKHDRREQLEAEAARTRRQVENAGRSGVSESGQQLDQQEHDATRQSLRWLAVCHMGHHRKHQKYRKDLLPLVESGFQRYGLSEPHGVTMHVDSDGQRWYADRQTVSGHWFAIGAAGPPPDEWLFDGSERPEAFPVESAWDRWGGGQHSTNWN